MAPISGDVVVKHYRKSGVTGNHTADHEHFVL